MIIKMACGHEEKIDGRSYSKKDIAWLRQQGRCNPCFKEFRQRLDDATISSFADILKGERNV